MIVGRLRLCRPLVLGTLVAVLVAGRVSAAPANGSEVLQAFLTLWSRDSGVTAASVDRLYAPTVIYYGKHLSRADILADKQRFARHWPTRSYQDVPGSVTTHCEPDGLRCSLRAVIDWRRATRDGVETTGRAQLRLEFLPIEGNRKIVRESARPL